MKCITIKINKEILIKKFKKFKILNIFYYIN